MAFDYLIKHKINIHQTDSLKNSAIFLCTKNWIKDQKLGADINVMNAHGENSLIYDVRQKNKANVEYLLSNYNINVNEKDELKRTAMHYLANDEDTSADINISIKEMLLNRNAEVNCQDIFGRTPIHYLFMKIKKEFKSAAIDPIVSLDTFLTVKGIQVDIPDVYGNTPLHYCSQRGASICAMSLIKAGASLKTKNKEGNSPLSYSLIFKQVNSSIILMQHNAIILDFAHPILPRENEKIKKVKDNKLVKNVSFPGSFNNNFQQPPADDEDEEDEEEDEEEEDKDEEDDEFSNPKNDAEVSKKKLKKGQEEKINKEIFITEDDKNIGVSLFRICVKFGYQGLTYLFINKGCDLMKGIQDSF